MYSSSLDFWYKKGKHETTEDKINETLEPFINKNREPINSPNQIIYESSAFNKENIPIFNWNDLNGKTLKISVYEGELGLSVIGIDEATGNMYVVYTKNNEKRNNK